MRASIQIPLLPYFYSDGQCAQILHKQNTFFLLLLSTYSLLFFFFHISHHLHFFSTLPSSLTLISSTLFYLTSILFLFSSSSISFLIFCSSFSYLSSYSLFLYFCSCYLFLFWSFTTCNSNIYLCKFNSITLFCIICFNKLVSSFSPISLINLFISTWLISMMFWFITTMFLTIETISLQKCSF